MLEEIYLLLLFYNLSVDMNAEMKSCSIDFIDLFNTFLCMQTFKLLNAYTVSYTKDNVSQLLSF